MRDDFRKKNIISPDLPGKLSRAVQGFVDVVGYLAVGTVETKEVHRLTLRGSDSLDAKSRLQTLREPYLDNPTMETIYAKLQGKGTVNGQQGKG